MRASVKGGGRGIIRSALLGGAILLLAAATAACAPKPEPVLRLATTTSTYDSGLLDAILPDFESSRRAKVDVIAVGTGQALALGERGDVDVVLVHAPALEQAFVQAGYGLARYPVMYNDFVVVGPASDPAGLAGELSAAAALTRIAEAEAPFASRGDNSGTHTKEMELWAAAGTSPTPELDWYLSLGQGMGATLQFANETQAYTLSDRGTYLALSDQLPQLRILVGGPSLEANPDPALRNPYSAIPVNPDLHEGIQGSLAQEFIEWIRSVQIQAQIADFGTEAGGQPLFIPSASE